MFIYIYRERVLFTYIYIYTYIYGPVVSKHGNLGPVGPARGAGSSTDRRINAICRFRARCEWTMSMA